MHHRLFALTLIVAALWPVSFASAAEEKSYGTWLTDDEKAKVELYGCGDAICSKIIWLKDPVDEKGKPYRDELNTDPKMRGRPIMGMDILQNTKKISDHAWTGEIYSPEDGKAYYLKHIALSSPKQVEIRGCLSSGWPCRTKYWTRAEPVEPPPLVASARPAASPLPRVASAPPLPRVASAPPQREASAAQLSQVPLAPAAPAYTPPPAPQPQRQAAVMPPPAAQTYAAPPASAPVFTPSPAPQRRVAPETTASLPRAMAVAPNDARGFHVQVLARQTQKDALQAYSEMQQRYPHLLGSIQPSVQMADLGSKGVWYRVRVGPIGEQSLAVTFCNRLKSEGADCIVREP